MNIENAILPIKINELISIISTKKRLNIVDAMGYLYSSEFYKRLHDNESKWWYLSGLNLYHELEKEKQKQLKIDAQLEKEKLFYVFCVEKYSATTNLPASEVLVLFQKYDVNNFITVNYDVLHTQGEAYILNEITVFLKNKNKNRK